MESPDNLEAPKDRLLARGLTKKKGHRLSFLTSPERHNPKNWCIWSFSWFASLITRLWQFLKSFWGDDKKELKLIYESSIFTDDESSTDSDDSADPKDEVKDKDL